MAEWDSGGFDETETSDGKPPSAPSAKPAKRWEGEDEEDDVKDSWDQDAEEEDEQQEVAVSSSALAEKGAAKGRKYDEKRRKRDTFDEVEEKKPTTPEEILAEKLRRRKLEEEADLQVAREMFGAGLLETKEEYDAFKGEIVRKLSDSTKNGYFVDFTEELIHCLCLNLGSADLKRIHTWVGNLHIEKAKLEKGEKSKRSKGKGKVKLKLEGSNDFTSEYSAYTEDYDDII